MVALVNYLKEIGVRDLDTPEQKLRKYNLLVIAIACSVIAPVWSYFSHLAGLEMAAYIPLLSIPVFALGVVSLHVTKSEKILLNLVLLTTLLCPIAMQWLAGGVLKGGIVVLWTFLAPLIALILREPGKANVLIILVLASIVGMGIFNAYFEAWGTFIDKEQKLWLLVFNLAAAIAAAYAGMQYFVNVIDRSKDTIEEKKQEANELLLNILPEHVAEEIKLKGRASPALYENTTILFSDFKDFTQFSELFTPEELISELATCFETFDEIITRHGLEKIKTIGDAYMCVGGIARDGTTGADSAERSVLAAMEMAEYIRDVRRKKLSDGKAYWDVRIGVHTGDIVAGIVGKKKFAFDIWGDAVNVANRLQTCSEEGRINISDTTYKLVKDYFICSPRGKIAVKNKGELDMYFVDERVQLA
jgi:class 3 adenylate cyclase